MVHTKYRELRYSMLLIHIQKYVLVHLRFKTVLKIQNLLFISSNPSSGFVSSANSCPGHIYLLNNKWKYFRHKNIANDTVTCLRLSSGIN